MLTEDLSYEEQLEDYRLVYELLKRKLRTSYISQLIKIGLAALHYCESCHGDTLVIYNNKFLPTCQICVLDNLRKKESAQRVI